MCTFCILNYTKDSKFCIKSIAKHLKNVLDPVQFILFLLSYYTFGSGLYTFFLHFKYHLVNLNHWNVELDLIALKASE